MKTTFKILLVAFIVIACQDSNKGEKQPDATDKTPETDYVILEFNAKEDWIFENVRPTELTEFELIKIEQILKKGIADYNLRQAESIKEYKEWFEEQQRKYPKRKLIEFELELKLEKYKRQYLPVINRYGDKEIWVNLFCTTEYSNWKEEIVIWHDGGNCFFNLKINLNKDSCSDFKVNGNV